MDDHQTFHLNRIGPAATKPGVADVMDFEKVTSLIGRNRGQVDFVLDSTNQIASQYISRLHARIVRQENKSNSHRLFDDSLNGIFINNTKIMGSVVLQEGDIVTFGHPCGVRLKPGVWTRQPDSEYQFIFEKCSCGSSGKIAPGKPAVLEDRINTHPSVFKKPLPGTLKPSVPHKNNFDELWNEIYHEQTTKPGVISSDQADKSSSKESGINQLEKAHADQQDILLLTNTFTNSSGSSCLVPAEQSKSCDSDQSDKSFVLPTGHKNKPDPSSDRSDNNTALTEARMILDKCMTTIAGMSATLFGSSTSSSGSLSAPKTDLCTTSSSQIKETEENDEPLELENESFFEQDCPLDETRVMETSTDMISNSVSDGTATFAKPTIESIADEVPVSVEIMSSLASSTPTKDSPLEANAHYIKSAALDTAVSLSVNDSSSSSLSSPVTRISTMSFSSALPTVSSNVQKSSSLSICTSSISISSQTPTITSSSVIASRAPLLLTQSVSSTMHSPVSNSVSDSDISNNPIQSEGKLDQSHREEVPDPTPTDLLQDVPDSTPSDLLQEVPDSTPTDLLQEVPDPTPTDLLQEVPDSTPADLFQEVPDSTPTNLLQEVPDSTPTDLLQEVPDSTPTDLLHEVPDPTPTDLLQEVPDSTPTDLLQTHSVDMENICQNINENTPLSSNLESHVNLISSKEKDVPVLSSNECSNNVCRDKEQVSPTTSACLISKEIVDINNMDTNTLSSPSPGIDNTTDASITNHPPAVSQSQGNKKSSAKKQKASNKNKKPIPLPETILFEGRVTRGQKRKQKRGCPCCGDTEIPNNKKPVHHNASSPKAITSNKRQNGRGKTNRSSGAGTDASLLRNVGTDTDIVYLLSESNGVICISDDEDVSMTKANYGNNGTVLSNVVDEPITIDDSVPSTSAANISITASNSNEIPVRENDGPIFFLTSDEMISSISVPLAGGVPLTSSHSQGNGGNQEQMSSSICPIDGTTPLNNNVFQQYINGVLNRNERVTGAAPEKKYVTDAAGKSYHTVMVQDEMVLIQNGPGQKGKEEEVCNNGMSTKEEMISHEIDDQTEVKDEIVKTDGMSPVRDENVTCKVEPHTPKLHDGGNALGESDFIPKEEDDDDNDRPSGENCVSSQLNAVLKVENEDVFWEGDNAMPLEEGGDNLKDENNSAAQMHGDDDDDDFTSLMHNDDDFIPHMYDDYDDNAAPQIDDVTFHPCDDDQAHNDEIKQNEYDDVTSQMDCTDVRQTDGGSDTTNDEIRSPEETSQIETSNANVQECSDLSPAVAIKTQDATPRAYSSNEMVDDTVIDGEFIPKRCDDVSHSTESRCLSQEDDTDTTLHKSDNVGSAYKEGCHIETGDDVISHSTVTHSPGSVSQDLMTNSTDSGSLSLSQDLTTNSTDSGSLSQDLIMTNNSTGSGSQSQELTTNSTGSGSLSQDLTTNSTDSGSLSQEDLTTNSTDSGSLSQNILTDKSDNKVTAKGNGFDVPAMPDDVYVDMKKEEDTHLNEDVTSPHGIDHLIGSGVTSTMKNGAHDYRDITTEIDDDDFPHQIENRNVIRQEDAPVAVGNKENCVGDDVSKSELSEIKENDIIVSEKPGNKENYGDVSENKEHYMGISESTENDIAALEKEDDIEMSEEENFIIESELTGIDENSYNSTDSVQEDGSGVGKQMNDANMSKVDYGNTLELKTDVTSYEPENIVMPLVDNNDITYDTEGDGLPQVQEEEFQHEEKNMYKGNESNETLLHINVQEVVFETVQQKKDDMLPQREDKCEKDVNILYPDQTVSSHNIREEIVESERAASILGENYESSIRYRENCTDTSFVTSTPVDCSVSNTHGILEQRLSPVIEDNFAFAKDCSSISEHKDSEQLMSREETLNADDLTTPSEISISFDANFESNSVSSNSKDDINTSFMQLEERNIHNSNSDADLKDKMAFGKQREKDNSNSISENGETFVHQSEKDNGIDQSEGAENKENGVGDEVSKSGLSEIKENDIIVSETAGNKENYGDVSENKEHDMGISESTEREENDIGALGKEDDIEMPKENFIIESELTGKDENVPVVSELTNVVSEKNENKLSFELHDVDTAKKRMKISGLHDGASSKNKVESNVSQLITGTTGLRDQRDESDLMGTSNAAVKKKQDVVEDLELKEKDGFQMFESGKDGGMQTPSCILSSESQEFGLECEIEKPFSETHNSESLQAQDEVEDSEPREVKTYEVTSDFVFEVSESSGMMPEQEHSSRESGLKSSDLEFEDGSNSESETQEEHVLLTSESQEFGLESEIEKPISDMESQQEQGEVEDSEPQEVKTYEVTSDFVFEVSESFGMMPEQEHSSRESGLKSSDLEFEDGSNSESETQEEHVLLTSESQEFGLESEIGKPISDMVSQQEQGEVEDSEPQEVKTYEVTSDFVFEVSESPSMMPEQEKVSRESESSKLNFQENESNSESGTQDHVLLTSEPQEFGLENEIEKPFSETHNSQSLQAQDDIDGSEPPNLKSLKEQDEDDSEAQEVKTYEVTSDIVFEVSESCGVMQKQEHSSRESGLKSSDLEFEGDRSNSESETQEEHVLLTSESQEFGLENEIEKPISDLESQQEQDEVDDSETQEVKTYEVTSDFVFKVSESPSMMPEQEKVSREESSPLKFEEDESGSMSESETQEPVLLSSESQEFGLESEIEKPISDLESQQEQDEVEVSEPREVKTYEVTSDDNIFEVESPGVMQEQDQVSRESDLNSNDLEIEDKSCSDIETQEPVMIYSESQEFGLECEMDKPFSETHDLEPLQEEDEEVDPETCEVSIGNAVSEVSEFPELKQKQEENRHNSSDSRTSLEFDEGEHGMKVSRLNDGKLEISQEFEFPKRDENQEKKGKEELETESIDQQEKELKVLKDEELFEISKSPDEWCSLKMQSGSMDEIRDVTNDDGIRDVTNDDEIRDVTNDDEIRDVTNDDGIRDVTNDDEIRDVTNDDEIRDVTNDDEIRDVTNDDEIRNVTNDDEIRDVTNDDEIRDVTNDDEIRDVNVTNDDEIRDVTNDDEIRDVTNDDEIRDVTNDDEIRDVNVTNDDEIRDVTNDDEIRDVTNDDEIRDVTNNDGIEHSHCNLKASAKEIELKNDETETCEDFPPVLQSSPTTGHKTCQDLNSSPTKSLFKLPLSVSPILNEQQSIDQCSTQESTQTPELIESLSTSSQDENQNNDVMSLSSSQVSDFKDDDDMRLRWSQSDTASSANASMESSEESHNPTQKVSVKCGDNVEIEQLKTKIDDESSDSDNDEVPLTTLNESEKPYELSAQPNKIIEEDEGKYENNCEKEKLKVNSGEFTEEAKVENLFHVSVVNVQEKPSERDVQNVISIEIQNQNSQHAEDKEGDTVDKRGSCEEKITCSKLLEGIASCSKKNIEGDLDLDVSGKTINNSVKDVAEESGDRNTIEIINLGDCDVVKETLKNINKENCNEDSTQRTMHGFIKSDNALKENAENCLDSQRVLFVKSNLGTATKSEYDMVRLNTVLESKDQIGNSNIATVKRQHVDIDTGSECSVEKKIKLYSNDGCENAPSPIFPLVVSFSDDDDDSDFDLFPALNRKRKICHGPLSESESEDKAKSSDSSKRNKPSESDIDTVISPSKNAKSISWTPVSFSSTSLTSSVTLTQPSQMPIRIELSPSFVDDATATDKEILESLSNADIGQPLSPLIDNQSLLTDSNSAQVLACNSEPSTVEESFDLNPSIEVEEIKTSPYKTYTEDGGFKNQKEDTDNDFLTSHDSLLQSSCSSNSPKSPLTQPLEEEDAPVSPDGRRAKREKLHTAVLHELQRMNKDIRTFLSKDKPNVEQAVSVLEDLQDTPINSTVLAKFPSIMETLNKCRKYKQSEDVRQLSHHIYNRFKALLL